MPLVQCTLFGAFRCRILYVNLLLFRNPSNGSSLAPLWLISTRSGTSVNFNQQSPAVCTCASGSKHTSLAMSHQTNALHGRSLNGPPPLPGRRSRSTLADRAGGGVPERLASVLSAQKDPHSETF